MDLNQLDSAARSFFETLTPAMKESIMQSGASLTTKNDLERFLQNSLADAKNVQASLEGQPPLRRPTYKELRVKNTFSHTVCAFARRANLPRRAKRQSASPTCTKK